MQIDDLAGRRHQQGIALGPTVDGRIGTVINNRICTSSAVEQVGTASSVDAVVTAQAVDVVGTGATGQRVVATGTVGLVALGHIQAKQHRHLRAVARIGNILGVCDATGQL